MKNRYLQHADGPTFTIPKPSRKDYGSDYPQPGFLAMYGNKLFTGIVCIIGAAIISFWLAVAAIIAMAPEAIGGYIKHLLSTFGA